MLSLSLLLLLQHTRETNTSHSVCVCAYACVRKAKEETEESRGEQRSDGSWLDDVNATAVFLGSVCVFGLRQVCVCVCVLRCIESWATRSSAKNVLLFHYATQLNMLLGMYAISGV